MIIIIQEHKYPHSAELIKCPDNVSASEVVELWQKKSIHYQVHGKYPPITWKIANTDNMVDAMIESSNL